MSAFVTLNVLNFAEVLLKLRICCQIQNQKATIFKEDLFIFYFMHMNVLPSCMSVPCICQQRTEEGVVSLELELCVTVSCHIGAGN